MNFLAYPVYALLNMKLLKSLFVVAGIFTLTSTAQATIDIQTSFVDNLNNADDVTGYGGVDYDYYIGVYEVTNSQYVSFLTANAVTDSHGLYNANMGSGFGGITQTGSSGSFSYSVRSGFGSKPVNFVSFWDAARFANWLTSGDTEVGVYDLTVEDKTVTRDATAWSNGGVALASKDEWYKAAYYDPTLDSGAGGYWDYAHQSNSIAEVDANYDFGVGHTEILTDVGSYLGKDSYYGTFDQGGNLWERNDDLVNHDTQRSMSGGAKNSLASELIASNFFQEQDGGGEFSGIGFRISSLEPVPEPATYGGIFGLLTLTVAIVRRKSRVSSC